MKSYEFGGALRAMGTAINEKKESAEVNRLVSYEDDQLERYQLFHGTKIFPQIGAYGSRILAEEARRERNRTGSNLFFRLS